MAGTKKSKRSEPRNPVLPEEMVANILCWLPGTSLVRFRCVCKTWQSIITDPHFIKTQIHCSQIMAMKKGSSLMITTEATYYNRPRFASISFQHYLHLPEHYTVIGSCNGILFLRNYVCCYLWNPATMQSKELPKCPEINGKALNYNFQTQVAFGFDALSDSYKVLRFICPDKFKPNVVPIVQLYSTDINSWKEIKVHDESISQIICGLNRKLGPVINGVLYMGHNGHLISFDLHTEAFTALLFPKSKIVKSEILDFEGSVAVVFESKKKRSPSLNPGDGPDSPTGLWTLGYNLHGERYWIKKFDINIRSVRSYLGGGLLYGKNKKKILYNYRDNEFKPFPRLAKKPEAVLRYTETLASVEGFERSVLFVSKVYPQVE
ncbi:putative F-box protein At3g10240 [Daucus carota subsp. sativus]|uniref:putative F-box protein At3g10240 n=1 Tax=Daucus carota subsp. sativus TaxID=79200 RepID=UPI0007F01ACA|nr:PREDICTED: putative F-box protein At3g10240 [Daucus carota subsp. sativus]